MSGMGCGEVARPTHHFLKIYIFYFLPPAVSLHLPGTTPQKKKIEICRARRAIPNEAIQGKG
jgi:hypothetical protein